MIVNCYTRKAYWNKQCILRLVPSASPDKTDIQILCAESNDDFSEEEIIFTQTHLNSYYSDNKEELINKMNKVIEYQRERILESLPNREIKIPVERNESKYGHFYDSYLFMELLKPTEGYPTCSIRLRVFVEEGRGVPFFGGGGIITDSIIEAPAEEYLWDDSALIDKYKPRLLKNPDSDNKIE